MKNIFKFAAMAFAAVVLAGGATSCEPDQEEKESIKTTLTILKQWKVMDEDMGMELAFDFGTTTPNQIYYTMTMMGQDNEETGNIDLIAMPIGKIIDIVETDETSGTIKVEGPSGEYDEEGNPKMIERELPYKDLTLFSVSIDKGIAQGLITTGNWYNFTLLSPSYVWAPMPEM